MMSNERVWYTKDKRAIRIKDMGDRHLVNATRLILNRGFRREYLNDFREEIERRGLRFTYEGSMYNGKWASIDMKPAVKKKNAAKHKWVILRRPKSYESPTDSDTSVSQDSTFGASSL